MTAHSKIGFSSRKRWQQCPGSVKLSGNVPSQSSVHAEEGTVAHALQEHCLRTGMPPSDMIGQDFAYDDHGEDRAIVVTKEMADYLTPVWDAIKDELLGDPDAVLLVEERFHLKQLHQDLFGTGDVAIWLPAKRRLQVRDLKYGAGVAVDVEDDDGQANPQLEGYALGALLKYPQWKPVDVEIVIDQPRAFHTDGPTRRKVLPVSYFVDMAADLVDEVHMTEQAAHHYGAQGWEDMYLREGDHCRWCPANRGSFCPLKKQRAQEMAKQAFAPGLPYDAEELAKILDYLPVLEAWIKNTREFAYAEAEKGHSVPHYKLVEKRATRKWKQSVVDGDRSALIAAGLNPADLFEQSLRTPAAIEKLLPKDQRSILDELCVRESSGHTLVHESDKREAVNLSAAAAFATK